MSEPEKIVVARYRCTHCRRSWANKSAAQWHAKQCWYDPANRGCKTCVHFSRGFSEADTGYQAKDECAVGLKFPLFERGGRIRQSLLTDCEAHRIRADYMNPDVIDVLGAAADEFTT